jgi:hypothetical protein
MAYKPETSIASKKFKVPSRLVNISETAKTKAPKIILNSNASKLKKRKNANLITANNTHNTIRVEKRLLNVI